MSIASAASSSSAASAITDVRSLEGYRNSLYNWTTVSSTCVGVTNPSSNVNIFKYILQIVLTIKASPVTAIGSDISSSNTIDISFILDGLRTSGVAQIFSYLPGGRTSHTLYCGVMAYPTGICVTIYGDSRFQIETLKVNGNTQPNFSNTTWSRSKPEIEEYTEEENITKIRALIIVERDTQRGIIIGKGGEMLKRIGREARLEIEKFIDQKVFLDTYVKVDKDWRASEQKLKKYGY